MLIMIDDVQLASDETFYRYISSALNCGNDGIENADKLYDVLCDMNDDVEVIIHDFDDVSDDRMKSAKEIIGVFMDARLKNKQLKVTFKND